MQETRRGRHERQRRSVIEVLHMGRDAAARRLRRLPSIVTRERVPIGKERA